MRWFRGGFVLTFVVGVHLVVLAFMAMQPAPQAFPLDRTPIFVSLAAGFPGAPAPAGGHTETAAALLAGHVPPPAADPSPGMSSQPPPVLPSVAKDSPRPELTVQGQTDASGPPTAVGSTPNSGVGGAGCNIEGQLQARLGGDPAVLSALRRLPTDAKSVSNAVQLWDGEWLTPAKLRSPELLGPIEGAIIQTLAAASPGCVAHDVAGPRLIILSEEDDTFIISLGSGSWRWSDVLKSSLPQQLMR